jgi:vitamin B12 transporter
MYYKAALLGAVALSGVTPAFAQTDDTDTTKLDTIIVEGSRLEQPATEMGSSVSIITADDISRLGFDFAGDAIAAAPGVTVNQNGTFGGTATVRIRGASSEQTLVLIDGVPVNDSTAPGGGYDFARLDTENIARIEILKGPQSTLWGTDAIGGVVSITTKEPEKRLAGSAFGEYGSFNTFRGGASIGNSGDAGDFRVALTGMSTDGISRADEQNGNTEDDGFDSLTASAKAGLNLPSNARLSATLLWNDAETEFDSFDGTAQGSVADGDESSETGQLSGDISLKAPLFDGRLENLLLVGYAQIDRKNFTNGIESFSTDGDRVVYRYQGTLNIDDRNKMAFGAEREDSSADGESTWINGLFALYEYKPVESLTLTGGLRLDDHERFGSETTGRVAAAFNPTEQVTLRASWGQGFKAPTIFQTTFFCCGATGPNAGLKAETSEAFDLGADWRSRDGRAEAGITYFDQTTDDMINFAFTVGGYENIDKVNSRGIEAYAGYQFTSWLGVAANYAYINAEDGTGTKLIQVPEQSGDITFSLDPDGPLSGAVLVRYNGEEPAFDGSTSDAWTRVDLTGRYQLSNGVEVFGRVENLFDEDYQQILGYGTPGLSGSVGIRLHY